MIGFVFTKIVSGRDKEFMKAIQDRDEIVEAHLITGEWDALLIIHGRNERDIVKFNLEHLRTLRDVVDSFPCLSVGSIKV